MKTRFAVIPLLLFAVNAFAAPHAPNFAGNGSVTIVPAVGKVGATATPAPSPVPVGKDFTVSWTANPASENVVKYTVGWGTASGAYPNTQDVTTGTTYSFANTASGPIFIVVKAVDKFGVASAWSNELAGVVDLGPTAPSGLQIQSGGLVNMSTRAIVQPGDSAMIAGFITTAPEKIAVRALGPSLKGVAGALTSTTLELRDAQGVLIRTNNGWATGQDAQALRDAKLAPASLKESAMIASVQSGSYTAIVRGAPSSGVGLVELYQLP